MLNGHAQVVESDGRDVTHPYVLAAWLALKTAQSQGCRFAIMTDGSPTCGSQNVQNPGPGQISSITLKYSTTGPGAIVTSAA